MAVVAVVLAALAARGGPPPLFAYQHGGKVSGVRAVTGEGPEATADSRRLRPVVTRTVEVPEHGERLATITFSAVCSHTGGTPDDYTTAEAIVRRHGERHATFGGVGRELVLCSDLGGGADHRAAVSHTWVTKLEGGTNHVVVRFASVGGEGVARLDDVVLVVTLSKGPCICP